MLAHDIFHLLNALPILFTLTMAVKLLKQLLSVILIDWLQLFHFSFVYFTATNVSWEDVVGVTEPDWFVVIFKKFASHLQYLDWIYLWDKVAHLVALLQTILILILHQELNVLTDSFKIILDFRIWLNGVNWGIEVDDQLFANTFLGLNACLNIINFGPLGFRLFGLEELVECRFVLHFDFVHLSCIF